MNHQEFAKRRVEIQSIFTPGTPIQHSNLFAGRTSQIKDMIDAITRPGYHAVLYGERGVGKTSLGIILRDILQPLSENSPIGIVRINCDTIADFSSLWRHVFKEIKIKHNLPQLGFASDKNEDPQIIEITLDRILAEPEIRPDDVRIAFERFAPGNIIILDEIDRVLDANTRRLFADTIKAFSDHMLPTTLVLIGVADSVDELIEGHQSIERSLLQIPMPRMSTDEVKLIIENGIKRLSMEIEESAKKLIVTLSKGLPHYTHLLGQHAALQALKYQRDKIILADIHEALDESIRGMSRSLKSKYFNAIESSRATLHADVLLACALSDTSAMGFFTAADVKENLSSLNNRPYPSSAFSNHLNEFSSAARSNILQRFGQPRSYRYRFTNSLMQPFIIMKGIQDGKISYQTLESLSM